jgi:hypothetical protein
MGNLYNHFRDSIYKIPLSMPPPLNSPFSDLCEDVAHNCGEGDKKV